MDLDCPHSLSSSTLTTAPRSLTGAVSAPDLPAYYALSERNQVRIQLLLQAFALISKAPTLTQGYELAAAQLGAQRGCRPGRLRTLYTQWRKTRDWRCLIDQALEWQPTTKVPADFVAHLNGEVDLTGDPGHQ